MYHPIWRRDFFHFQKINTIPWLSYADDIQSFFISVKYSYINIFHRHSLYTFYAKSNNAVQSRHRQGINRHGYCLILRNNISLQWRHNERDLRIPASRLFTQPFIQAQIKETSKLRVTGLCEGNSPTTDEFPTQMSSNAENIPIWWRHHDWHIGRLSKVHSKYINMQIVAFLVCEWYYRTLCLRTN